jgi:Trypsin
MSARVRGLALASVLAVLCVGGVAPAGAVVGGSPIQVQSAPWAVFVTDEFATVEDQCSGSVLDATHVLTAAHCLYDDNGALTQPSALSVEAGISNFVAPTANDAEQDRAVSSFRVHPGFRYTGSGGPDDVAVLTLASPLDLSGPAVQAIALPTSPSTFPSGAAVAIAGFGVQQPPNGDTGELVSMSATVDEQGECGDFTQSALLESDNAVVLCATSPVSAVCNGDSGGGLVTTGGTPVLVGVVTAGPLGCPVGTPGLFAYVGAPEILSFIQGNDQPPTAPRPAAGTTSELTWAAPLDVGDVVSCSTAGWPEPVQVVYTFANASTGAVLQSGPDPRYVVPPDALGISIVCKLAVSDAGGTTVAETNASTAVARVPQVTIERPALLVARRGRRVTLHVVLRSPAGLSGKFGVCVVLPAKVGGRSCASRREPLGAAGRFSFALSLPIRASAPLGRSRASITAVAGRSSARSSVSLRIVRR